MFVEHENPTELAKEIFYLAWKASNIVGMGRLQNRPEATKQDVWNNIVNAGDYPFQHNKNQNRPYADYVFGRMMKFGLNIEKNGVYIVDQELAPDYQSWCRTYKSVEELVNNAVENLNNRDYLASWRNWQTHRT